MDKEIAPPPSPPAAETQLFLSLSSSSDSSDSPPRLQTMASRLPKNWLRLPTQLAPTSWSRRSLGFAPKQLAIVTIVALLVAMLVVEARLLHLPRHIVADAQAAARPGRDALRGAAHLYADDPSDTPLWSEEEDDTAGSILPADDGCSDGVRSGRVCCAASCGECGGVGCADRVGGAHACCKGEVFTSGVSCAEAPAPCLIDLSGDALHKRKRGTAARDAAIIDAAIGDRWGRAINEDRGTHTSKQKPTQKLAISTISQKKKKKKKKTTTTKKKKKKQKKTSTASSSSAAVSSLEDYDLDARGFSAARADGRCGRSWADAQCAYDSAEPCCSSGG